MDIISPVPERPASQSIPAIQIDESVSLQRTPSLPPAGPAMHVIEPPEAVPEAVSERGRLTQEKEKIFYF